MDTGGVLGRGAARDQSVRDRHRGLRHEQLARLQQLRAVAVGRRRRLLQPGPHRHAHLVGKHHVAPKPGQKTATGQNPGFREQTQAMVVGWSTESRNYLQTKELEWDAAPMPKGAVQSLSMYGYNPLAPTTQSNQLDAAW